MTVRVVGSQAPKPANLWPSDEQSEYCSPIDLWLLPLADHVWKNPRGTRLLDALSADERRREDRLKVESKRKQFARARAGLRQILGRILDTDPTALKFGTGNHGRPHLDGPTSSRVAFNLSHSGQLAVVATRSIADQGAAPVGIDVERVDRRRPLDRMAKRFFSTSEHEAYSRLPSAAKVDDFYRRWALKEAYLKALGTGLTYSSRAFVVADDPPTWQLRKLLVSCERYPEQIADWQFANGWLEFGDQRFSLAVCGSAAEPEARVRLFSVEL